MCIRDRYWDRVARRIYDLRMERDRKIQRLLTPAQFNLYVRFVREHPQRIHDYRGWYANPRYPDRRPSHDCRRYEDNYWNYRWGTIHHDNCLLYTSVFLSFLIRRAAW